MNPSFLKRLKWDGTGHTTAEFSGERAVMARSLAYLFLSGATLTLLLLAALPHPEANVAGMIAVVAAAYAISAAVLIAFNRIPRWMFAVIVGVGSVVISLGIYFRGAPGTAHALFYLWVTFYAFYFFSLRLAVAELVLSATLYAIVLATLSEPPAHPVELSMVMLGTLTVTGALVHMLRRRIDLLVDRLADAARRDVLTGLLNRRGFEELFELELERSTRGHRMLSVIVGDLDNFKLINDRFGHQSGDVVLERAATILKRRKRRIDTVARIGGEEFALVVPDTDEHRCYMLAERLRSELKRSFADDPIPLTISFGVASFPAHGDSPEALLHAADEALYAAKEMGRDRAVIHSHEIAGIFSPADKQLRPRDEHLSTVLALAETLDIRDAGTAEHSVTVGRYAQMAASELGIEPATTERVRIAGILHDIGKIGIPDSVLGKPGPLTDGEWTEIRKHPEIGARILAHAGLGDIGEWVLAHHERPDGTGFPYGLALEEIPIEARILAVADAYEAMTSDRVYRAAMDHEHAQAALAQQADRQFDRRVVEAFLRILKRDGHEPIDFADLHGIPVVPPEAERG